jgi:hypothetical protein
MKGNKIAVRRLSSLVVDLTLFETHVRDTNRTPRILGRAPAPSLAPAPGLYKALPISKEQKVESVLVITVSLIVLVLQPGGNSPYEWQKW